MLAVFLLLLLFLSFRWSCFWQGLASILSPVVLNAHPMTMWLWLCVSIQLSVDAHSGYDFPVSIASVLPSQLGPLKLGGAKHHDDHHNYFR